MFSFGKISTSFMATRFSINTSSTCFSSQTVVLHAYPELLCSMVQATSVLMHEVILQARTLGKNVSRPTGFLYFGSSSLHVFFLSLSAMPCHVLFLYCIVFFGYVFVFIFILSCLNLQLRYFIFILSSFCLHLHFVFIFIFWLCFCLNLQLRYYQSFR
jgi:hypothetical protein